MTIANVDIREWISVDEKLPKGIVLACFKPTRTNQRIIIRAQYVNQFEEPSEGDTDNYEYNADDDTSYIPAGWYECISNWDDYSSVSVDGIVTHWIPLPKPPSVQSGSNVGLCVNAEIDLVYEFRKPRKEIIEKMDRSWLLKAADEIERLRILVADNFALQEPVGEVEYEYAGELRIDQRVKWAKDALGILKSGDKLYGAPKKP